MKPHQRVDVGTPSEEPGRQTKPVNGRENSIRTAMPMPPATMMKFADRAETHASLLGDRPA